MTAILLALWLCNVHLVADILVIATFLVAVTVLRSSTVC